MNFLLLYTHLFGLTVIYMTLWFMFSLLKGRNDVVDTAWGFGFLGVVLYAYSINGFAWDRGLLVLGLISLWSFRLSLHLHLRNSKKSEDYRYQEMREKWGSKVLINSFLYVFMLQGFLMLIIATPAVFAAFYRGGPLTVIDFFGVSCWCIGFFFEAVGDWQLAVFLSDPQNKGAIMQTGLWRYTRHPNYFGEVTMWWSLWLIALSIPFGWTTIVGPLLITFLILKVSGIPLLEKKMEEDPVFIEYKKRTSAFFPWWPGK